MTFCVCVANSRVGFMMRTWISRVCVSRSCSDTIESIAVLPVPDCDCAITSRPWDIGTIARCWIAEGFSNP